VLPAIVSLIAATYSGPQRALAFGIVGGVAGAAIAAGPLIGGWVTTEFTWRYVFAAETVVVILILLVRRRMGSKAGAVEHPPQLDLVGVALSSLGLALIVFGILKSSEWGLIEPKGALTIDGQEITPLGFSVVPFLMLAGATLLGAFTLWEDRRERAGKDTLLDRSLLRIERLRAGLSTLLMQQLILLGIFFVLPVYLQVVLGLDAFETGKRLFPMSVTMFAAAMLGPKLASKLAPRLVAQAGLWPWSPAPRCCSARSTSSSRAPSSRSRSPCSASARDCSSRSSATSSCRRSIPPRSTRPAACRAPPRISEHRLAPR
jgi:MFS family permease